MVELNEKKMIWEELLSLLRLFFKVCLETWALCSGSNKLRRRWHTEQPWPASPSFVYLAVLLSQSLRLWPIFLTSYVRVPQCPEGEQHCGEDITFFFQPSFHEGILSECLSGQGLYIFTFLCQWRGLWVSRLSMRCHQGYSLVAKVQRVPS